MARYYPLKPGAARPVTIAEIILPAVIIGIRDAV
jgi:hypothetical protein